MPQVPPHDENGIDDLSWEAREALEDPEGPQPCDLVAEDDDETPTVPCPACGEAIPDFADRCPYCGEWVVQGGAPGRSGRGVAFVVIVLLLIVALLYWLW